MPRSGLTKQRVVEVAADWIEANGTAHFTMRALAESLGVQSASLYNHIAGQEMLLSEVCAYALCMQRDAEMRAIEGKRGPEAIEALAHAYRRFAKEHRQLYRLIMNHAVALDGRIEGIAECVVEPFLRALSDTALTEDEKRHWQRVLRAVVHGFVSEEEAGFFAHLPLDVEDSFQTAVTCCLDGLIQAENRRRT